MTLLRRATEQQQTDWIPVPEGLWRWLLGKPEVLVPDKFGYRVRFPLTLTEAEKKRLEAEHPREDISDEGVQQSWRTSYTCGLSLGYIKRDGQYQSTKLIDMLAACLGSQNSRKFREWIAGGGGPPRPDDPDDQQMEIDEISDWLGWWDNLEVYGSIRHNTNEAGQTFANFAGPMPVGSLPGQKDDEYQAHGRGKLRAIISESEAGQEKPQPVAASTKPAVQYTADGDEIPF